VVSSVALLLERFDRSAMQESLRRYVPGAVAGALASGKELAPSVREVAVMFVDIRGYTSYSEGREASEIFSTVSRYTERVSEVVTRHGGTIVEFNGDGMMTVFGAPQELASKEAAAVRAGLEILQSLDADPLVGTGSTRRIAVGVGIATGEAYAGSIRAVDRMIWTAIGNTTNLASRLQGLTRTLDASMAIDRATEARIGSLRTLFDKQPGVRIAGRSELIDVFVLRRNEADR
jgi:class 3 adenylate cyclase